MQLISSLRHRFWPAAAAVSLMPSAASTWAQSSSLSTNGADRTQNSDATIKIDSGTLEEITVTARRRSEILQDVPAAVTAFSAEDLQRAGVDSPSDFLNITPGVYFRNNTTAGTSFINIRGVTQSRNAESPVAVVVDGVFLNNPLTFQNQLVDIQQIEVLKGPQGALYGRNAEAGAILVTTTAPSNDYSGYVRGEIGRHSSSNVEAAFGGPIIADRLMFRAVAYHSGTDGFLKNQFLSNTGPGGTTVYGDAASNDGARARLLFLATDQLHLDTRFSYSQTKGGFNDTIFDPSNNGNTEIIHQIPYEPNSPGFTNRRIYDASEKIDFETPYGTLTSISGYNNYAESSGGDALPYSPAAINTQWLINEFKSESEEIRFTSPSDRKFRWLAGGYIQHTDRFFGSSQGVDTGMGIVVIDRTGAQTGSDSVNPALSISADKIWQNSYAAFAQAECDLTDMLELSAALRYDHDQERDTDVAPTKVLGAAGKFNYESGPGGRVRELSFSRPQPKVTLRYRPDADNNLYVTYAEGFKNGGFNPSTVPLAFQSFHEETIRTIETGYKGRFLNNRLSLDAAAYYTRETGVNFLDFIPAIVAQVNVNIEKIQLYGAEASIAARVTDEFTIIAAVTGIKSKIEENSFDPLSVGQRAPAFPNMTGNLTVNWEKPVSRNWSVFARAYDQYTGSLQWDLEGIVKRSPLNLLDLRAGVTRDRDAAPLTIDMYCRNCTNRDYINESVFVSGNIGTVDFPVINAWVWGVEIRKQF
jgi:iron complex outermembrane recepter protein